MWSARTNLMERRARTALLVALVVASFATAAPAQSDPCSRHTSCAACTPVSGCGWCGGPRGGRCMSGTGSGAAGCSGNWAWLASQCASGGVASAPPGTDRCPQYTSCAACAADATCGWCGAANRCMRGTDWGAPGCSGHWSWTSRQCATGGGPSAPPGTDRCPQYTNCDACATDLACGWCGAANRCMRGTAAGATGCSGGWTWHASQCTGVSTPGGRVTPSAPPPGSADSCSAYGSCATCTPQGFCGWCGATGRCMHGGSGTSAAPGCPGGWAYYLYQCGGSGPTTTTTPTTTPTTPTTPPASDPCAAYRTCDTCTPVSNCGWCAAANACMGGGPGGSSRCPGGWAYYTSSCGGGAGPPNTGCGAVSGCEACTGTPGCGWCRTSGCVPQGTGESTCPRGQYVHSAPMCR